MKIDRKLRVILLTDKQTDARTLAKTLPP